MIDPKVGELLGRCRADYAVARQSVDDVALMERRATTMEEKLRQQQCTAMIDWIDYVTGKPAKPLPTPPSIPTEKDTP